MKMKKFLWTLLFAIGMLTMVPDVTSQAATTYEVKYKKNGGSGTNKTDKVTAGTKHKFRANTTFTKKGHTLSKWNTKKDGSGTSYKCGKKVTINKDITVYAQWKANAYTVSFDSKGGNSISSKTVTYNKTYGTLTAPSRTGYTFVGWFTATSGGTQITSSTKVKITAAQTLYAQWKAIEYVVKFDSTGGTAVADKKVTYDSTYGSMATPTKTGYTFAGWYTAKIGGTEITESTTVKITSAQTLYAHWTANTYTLNYNTQGGNALNGKTVTYDAAYGTLPKPVREGYTFAGWFNAVNGGTQITDNTIVKTDGHHTLYARWNEHSYTIQYNANDGKATGTMTSQTQKYSQTVALNMNQYVKEGFHFGGWSTKDDGNGTVYTDGQEVSKLTTSNGQVITLYAIWIADRYTFSFELNGSNGDKPEDKEQAYDEVLILPSDLYQRDGYTWKEWNTKPDGTGISMVDSVVKVDAELAQYADENNCIKLYAIGTPMNYSIYFFNEDEDVEMPEEIYEKEVTFDQTVGELPIPTRKYYDFTGWALEDGTVISEDTIYQYPDDVELYSTWKLKIFTVTFDANKGYLLDSSQAVRKIEAKSSLGTMPVVKRKGYKFKGWVRIKDGKKTTITADTKLGADMTLTAQWKKVKAPKKVNKVEAKRKAKGKQIALKIKMPKNAKAEGYKIQYSTNKKFKKKATTTITTTKKQVTLKKIKKSKTYYIRVCAFNKDSEGNLKQSKWKTITVNK